MKRAVIDTNVLISSLLKKGSVPDLVMEDVRNGELVPVVNAYLRAEYAKVLSRDKFHFETDLMERLLKDIDGAAWECGTKIRGQTLNDPKDQEIYELFLAAKHDCNAVLITGNLKHYPQEEGILSPREYLDNKDALL